MESVEVPVIEEPVIELEEGMELGCDGVLRVQEASSDRLQFGLAGTQLSTFGEIRPGDLVRSPESSAVYCITQDYMRRPYTTALVFFTHFMTFDDVRWVTPEAYFSMPLFTPMLPKVGVVLLKYTVSPKVFLHQTREGDPSRGDLSWIVSEENARYLLGEEWTDYVIDIPSDLESFFVEVDPLLDPLGQSTSKFRKRVELK
jgi:hypothetical protein